MVCYQSLWKDADPGIPEVDDAKEALQRLEKEVGWVGRYEIKKSNWLEWNTYRSPKLLVRPTFPELYSQDKLLLGRQTKVATFDNKKHIVDNTIIVCMQYMQLKGVNNRNLNKYFSNIGISRGQLEEESIKFNHLYILGIINSSRVNK